MILEAIGAWCFGLVAGWVAFRTLLGSRASSLAGITAVAGAVGGAAVVSSFGSGRSFGWHCLGLALGFFACGLLALITVGRRSTAWLEQPVDPRLVRRWMEGAALGPGPEVVKGDVSTILPRMRARREARAFRAAEKLEPSTPDRYANAALLEAEGPRRLNEERPIAPGLVFRLRLDIGELSRESHVESPEPLPEHLLPRADLPLAVMLFSTEFAVGRAPEELGDSRVAHGEFVLPADGGPALTPEGERELLFYLRAPREEGAARARVGYYYRDALIQSQLVEADVGTREGGFRITIDYTLSHTLTDVESISERPRLTLVSNDDGHGNHLLALRGAGATGRPEGAAFEIEKDVVGKLVGRFREELRHAAPTSGKRSRRDLERDLRSLAPLGWDLWSSLLQDEERLALAASLWRKPESWVFHASRIDGSTFLFPWSFLYEIPLDHDAVREGDLTLCPLVAEWDERRPLVEGDPRQCPHAGEAGHQSNTLCPFGFWGYRYSIEQLSSNKDPSTRILVPPSFSWVAGETEDLRRPRELEAHIGELRRILAQAYPRAAFEEGKTKAQVKILLGKDLPLVYFYCHGDYPDPGSSDTYLVVGPGEWIGPQEFKGWLWNWLTREDRKVWDRLRPLIFINACHSLEIRPETLVSNLDAFVKAAGAAGVIGTEVRVDQQLAMDVAARFFRRFVGDGWTVDRALREIRIDYLAQGNLLGLVYTPYCWADLSLAPA